MPDADQTSEVRDILTSWAKVCLFVVAIGLVFGANVALDFVTSFGQFFLALLLGGIAWLAIFGSIRWVFNRTERKSGRDAAVVAMFMYVLVGLPLLVWVLEILAGVFK